MILRAAIGLGASLGQVATTLELAARAIDAHPGIEVVRASRLYGSAPAGGVASRPFQNAVLLVHTSLMPVTVHDLCKAIELRLGRRPTRRWSDRIVDIDLLAFEGARVSGRVTVPHPRMTERPFVLVPLAEVWPDAVDPQTGNAYATFPAAGARLPLLGALPAACPSNAAGRGIHRLASRCSPS